MAFPPRVILPFLCACVGFRSTSFPGGGFQVRGRGSSQGLVSTPAAAAPEPSLVAGVEGGVEAEARRHHG